MNDPVISIILPTRNEAENIPVIVPAISAVLHSVPHEILVMDDASADGTPEVVENLSANYPVRVFRRQKNPGLSYAVIEGFSLAKGKILVVMDADLSHPPEVLLQMVAPILEDRADATVASRYIPGGGCEGWSFTRQVISRGSGFLAKGFTRLSDPTTGFMAVRSSLLKDVELNPIGWKIVLEVITKTKPRLVEVPIIFRDRLHGESKANLWVMFDYAKHLWSLYNFSLPKLLEFVKFCLVGSSGLLVDSAFLFFLVEAFGMDPRSGLVGSFIVAVTWNFLLNEKWTFQASTGSRIRAYLSFVSVCLGGLALRLLIMQLFVLMFPTADGLWYLLVNAGGILVATASNFFGSKYLAFRKGQGKS